MLRFSFDDIGRNSLPSSSHESHTSELYPISSASSDRIRLRSPKVILEFIYLLELSIRIIFQSLSGICIPKMFAQVSFPEVLLSGYLRPVESVDILFPCQNSRYIFLHKESRILTMGQRTMSHVCNLWWNKQEICFVCGMSYCVIRILNSTFWILNSTRHQWCGLSCYFFPPVVFPFFSLLFWTVEAFCRPVLSFSTVDKLATVQAHLRFLTRKFLKHHT